MADKHVLVVLSGCGFLDGSEIHEAVIALLSLERFGARYTCAAPDKAQAEVVNHRTGEVVAEESRNVLDEAARIARGRILPLEMVNPAHYDAVFLPGGFGAAKNLSNVASAGPAATVDPEVKRVLQGFRSAGKPIGAVCIAPAMLIAALREGDVTIGDDPGTAAAINKMGGSHHNCPVTEMYVDKQRKIVTAPAYMYDARIADVATGIEKAVGAMLELS